MGIGIGAATCTPEVLVQSDACSYSFPFVDLIRLAGVLVLRHTWRVY